MAREPQAVLPSALLETLSQNAEREVRCRNTLYDETVQVAQAGGLPRPGASWKGCCDAPSSCLRISLPLAR